jgi:hypothetical protein
MLDVLILSRSEESMAGTLRAMTDQPTRPPSRARLSGDAMQCGKRDGNEKKDRGPRRVPWTRTYLGS